MSSKNEFEKRIHDILDLDKLGFPLSKERIAEGMSESLEKELVSEKKLKQATSDKAITEELYDGRKHLWLYFAPPDRGPGTSYDEPCYYDRIPQEWKDQWKDKEISKEDWCPDFAPRKIDANLRSLLLSCNPRFDRLIPEKRFWLYCEQARRWGPEANKAEDLTNNTLQEAYKQQEYGRVHQNKLYGLDGYVTIKDETQGGRRIYKASTPQALLMFLKDCGYSIILLKGRQAAITSTMMAAAVLTALITPAYKGAIVADKEKTGLGIFNDKFKSTFQFLPSWWRPDEKGMPWSDRRVIFDFDPGESKSEKRKYMSEMQTYSSADSQTLNSNSPTEVYFDEAQKTSTLQEILKEVRPTMLAATSKGLKMLRSVFIWGTGGTGDIGKGAFEGQLKGAMKRLDDHSSDKVFLVPIFFDAFCRPYMDRETYLDQYDDYLNGDNEYTRGMTPEQNRAIFAAHYPMTPEDSFMASTKSIVAGSIIKKQRDRILKECHPYEALKPKKGKFYPVYNYSNKMPPGSWQPYEIVDARFEAVKMDEFDAPVTMFRPHDTNSRPDNGYIHRFFQGTDPIQSQTGKSKMSSAIWDAAAVERVVDGVKYYVPTVSCIVNYRPEDDLNEAFLQCVLMGIYYRNHGQKKCMELVEYDQGHNYIEFQKAPFIMTQESLLLRAMLLPAYNGSNHGLMNGSVKGAIGLSMKKGTKTRAYQDLAELIMDYGSNIYFIEFWNQLMNVQTEEKEDGTVSWGTKDFKIYNDDLVDAILFCYLAWRSINEKPKKIGGEEAPEKTIQKVRYRDPLTDQLTYREELVETAYA